MAEVTEQIIREAPEIEALKVGLIKSAKTLSEQPLAIPAYEAAGLSDLQKQAMQLGAQGIGAYAPFLQAGQGAMEAGIGTLGQAATAAGGINLAPQFNVAQTALESGLAQTAAFPELARAAASGIPTISAGAEAVGAAQGMVPYAANLAASQGVLEQAAQMAARAPQLGAAPTISGVPQVGTQGISAAQMGFQPGLQTFQMGPAERLSTQTFGAPGAAESLMSPYMQNVVGIQQREAIRQGDIARQARAAQAIRTGAFGGTREGVVEAEAQRNLAQQLGDIQAGGLQQAYQQAQQQFNVEQQARLAAQQANQAAGLTIGQQNLAAALGVQQLGTQTGLQSALANLTNEQQARVQSEANRLQAQGMNQQAAMQAALANQQMLGQYGLTGAQLGLSAANQLAGIGGTLGQQALSQAQLGQAGAGLLGQLGTQQAQLGLLPAQLAGQQASILGQGISATGALGQGIGSLAAQYGGLGLQQAGMLGNLGQAMGQAGLQQAQLGEAATRLGLQDISTLMSLGQTQQQAEQNRLEAARATALQKAMTPYQQLSFLSDIYKGAPGTQMAITAGTAPSTSPLLQAAGLGVAGLSAAAGAQRAGLFG